jgi:hypothetical protein
MMRSGTTLRLLRLSVALLGIAAASFIAGLWVGFELGSGPARLLDLLR